MAEQYLEHLMVFREDGSVVFSTYTADVITGTWNTSISNGAVNLRLEFENFTDFTSYWQVYKLEENLIKLYKDDGNKIALERNLITENCAPQKIFSLYSSWYMYIRLY